MPGWLSYMLLYNLPKKSATAWFLFALLVSASLSACSNKAESAAIVEPTAAVAQAPNSGQILQLLQAAGYTYAEVQASSGQKVWMAGAPLQLKVGDSVQWGDYAVMRNFSSKALGRVFDEILFVNSWGSPGGISTQVAHHGAPPENQNATGLQRSPDSQVSTSQTNRGEVKSAAIAGGYSYLEIKQNDAVVWVAAPQAAVKAGDTVMWNDGALMQNFAAKSLGRTFDKIIFVGNVTVVQ